MRIHFRFVLITLLGLTVGTLPCVADGIDVFLMAGQSNMQGVGLNAELPAEYLPQPNVSLYHSFATAGLSNVWRPNGPNGFVGATFGPEISLGHRLSELMPGAQIALIKHAFGGTTLGVDWDPGEAGNPGSFGPRYQEFMDTVSSGLAALAAENPGSEIRLRGMFWHQGETDSTNAALANAYEQNMVEFIGRVREDVGVADLPFILGAVADSTLAEVPAYVYNDLIIDSQFNVDQDSGSPSATLGAYIVDSREFPTRPDFIHYNTQGQLELGEAFADTYWANVPEPGSMGTIALAVVLLIRRRN
jgi:Carbohydrate esterase, sialic acid-specific acetylesterase